MSWKWIPAQLTNTLGDDTSSHNSTGLDKTKFRPGYYIGVDDDYEKVLVNVNNTEISSNKWIVMKYPWIKLKVTEVMNDGTESTFDMTLSGETGNITTSNMRNPEGISVYGGKYVFKGIDSNVTLSYSLTQNSYIIHNRYEAAKYGMEPAYSVDEATGKAKGEYFWKPGGSLTDINWDTNFPITFNLSGNVNAFDDDDTYIDHYVVDLSPDYYHYSSSFASQETPPAGEYVNSVTGEKTYVGVKCFLGDDGSIWKARRLGRVRESGSGLSNSYENWYSDEHGGKNCYLGYIPNSHTWATAHSSRQPYYTCSYQGNSLVDANSVNLIYYEWDPDAGQYVTDSSKNLTLTKGPMQTYSEPIKILMGDYSQWRS